MYGWKARIGFMSPGQVVSDIVTHEFYRLVPPGVTMAIATLGIRQLTNRDMAGALEQIEKTAADLAAEQVDMIIMGGAPPTSYDGIGADKKIVERIQKASGLPATTILSEVVKALNLFSAKSLVMATPWYQNEINEKLRAFFTGYGFKVLNIKHLERSLPEVSRISTPIFPLSAYYRIPWQAYRLAKQSFYESSEEPDAIYMPCGAWPTAEIIKELETELGKPVVTSLTAKIWGSLRMMKINTDTVEGYGRLFKMT
jgi:maleate cis-trans isomerase